MKSDAVRLKDKSLNRGKCKYKVYRSAFLKGRYLVFYCSNQNHYHGESNSNLSPIIKEDSVVLHAPSFYEKMVKS